ncbi:MAG: ABC transporter permease, partial [Verrucomicrobia bacterium]|nr:ABC transporter permease [Verrucomicrobiota bacterium]
MNRSFSLFLALRYLKPRRTFLSIITLISVLGVTLGIMVMIVVISVMSGFDLELKKKIVGFDAHIVIAKDGGILDEWRELLPKVKQTPEVEAAAPFVFGPVVAEIQKENSGRRVAPKIRAVDPAAEMRISDIAQCVESGKFDLEGNSVVIGKELARSLGAEVGDKLTLYSPGNLNELMTKLDELEKKEGAAAKQEIADIKSVITPTEVTITGIFSSGRFLYDSEIIFVPLFLGQELYGLGDGVHGLAVRTVEPYRAGQVKNALEARLPMAADNL